ncbi:MOSC domain-containing protein [uncultured Paracoccus sp.]|uniref:MOSC domain-containing protein n=1 Tax=uncultured Paracoccus sp. TaxID=189685 RepID=UPI0026354313|nr:MOSC domain-containing protein [uncultured Paracoccus sp.]
MTARLAHIRRHPIKSVGGEGLDHVTLSAARRLPGDREWAVLTEAGEHQVAQSGGGGEPDHWLPKTCFVRGVAEPSLQAIEGGWQDGRLRLTHPDRPTLTFDPQTQGDEAVAWLRPLWSADRAAPTRLVRGVGIWTDVQPPWMSILSLSSLAALEDRLGRPLGLRRWRANLWVEGWPAFAELDMIGQILTIGPVELRVTRRIGRCAATSADTTTGRIDGDMPHDLQALFGHRDFGIYAEVVNGGTIGIGDAVSR